MPCLWNSDGRSAATRDRAFAAGMVEVACLAELVERADVLVSVCPPSEALRIADDVAATGFDGIYVDANAISPARTRQIGKRFARFVDAGIIGPPAWDPGSTRLYLAGAEADTVAARWHGSHLDARVLGGEVGAASALKMCFATWTKVSGALLLSVRALAAAEGIDDDLIAEWTMSFPHLARQSEGTASGSGPKAWPFVGEMGEIADSFAAAGLPDGFGRAAAEIYSRLAPLQQIADPSLAEVIDLIGGS